MKTINLSYKTEQEIIQKFKNNISIHAIGKELGIGRRVIEKVLIANNLELKTKSELLANAIPELLSREYMYHAHMIRNKSLTDIAVDLNTNDQVIKTAFKRLNIKIKSAIQSKNDKVLEKYPLLKDKEWLQNQYSHQQISVEAIAKALGSSDSMVKTQLKKFNISTRDHGEAMKLHRAGAAQLKNAQIARNVRTRFSIALHEESAYKYYSAVDDIGMSIEDFKEYIKPQFGPGMTWDNYGEWHLDHIKPLSSFSLSDPDEQKKAIHYSNYRPEWGILNQAKSDWQPIGELPNKVPLYIITGLCGSGKSWVCNQLLHLANYVSYDKHYKEQHYHIMVEFSKENKPILYDPNRKATTFLGRYNHYFDTKLIIIDEPIEVITQRIVDRGGKYNPASLKKMTDSIDRARKYASFVGSSDAVLNFLTKDLLPKADPSNV